MWSDIAIILIETFIYVYEAIWHSSKNISTYKASIIKKEADVHDVDLWRRLAFELLNSHSPV